MCLASMDRPIRLRGFRLRRWARRVAKVAVWTWLFLLCAVAWVGFFILLAWVFG